MFKTWMAFFYEDRGGYFINHHQEVCAEDREQAFEVCQLNPDFRFFDVIGISLCEADEWLRINQPRSYKSSEKQTEGEGKCD